MRRDEIRGILLVRLSAMGDIVFASPLIASFRRAYPNARLAWLVQPEFAELLEHHPDLDRVLIWPRKKWRELWRKRRFGELYREIGRLRRELEAANFDIAVDLQGLLKSGLLARLSGARERIGLGSRELSGHVMTRVVPRGGDPLRIASEYRYLAETLELPSDDFTMAVHYGGAAAAHADRVIASHGWESGYAVVCPFTTRPQKHWFESRWAELVGRIGEAFGLPVAVLGGPGDRAAGARIAAAAGGAVDLTGQTSLCQAAALIDRGALLIGVDTGLSHMGIALATPTVSLFGSTCPYLETGRAGARVLYHRLPCSPCRRSPTCNGDYTCMREIQVDEVLATARAVLDA